MLEQLTERQRKVYLFIRDLIHNRGYGPTVREIGEEFEIASPNGVMCHLRALERKGLIRRSKREARAIELLGDTGPESLEGLPLALRMKLSFGMPLHSHSKEIKRQPHWLTEIIEKAGK